MTRADSNDVVITGVGPVTPIGVGGDALWASLAAGRADVSPRELPLDLGVSVELQMAAMPAPSELPGMDAHYRFLASQECEPYRDLAYTLLAVELALRDAGISFERDANDIGMVQAFEAPGVEHTVSKLLGMMAGPMPTDGPPRVYDHLAPSFYNMQPFLYLHIVSKAFGLHGFATSVHNACSSGAYAIEVAAQQIRSGQSDVVVVVGGEAFDTAVRLEWFRRLELYSLDGQMRPFDAESSGFYVGEGAGAIVMESAGHARQRRAEVYASYVGGAFAQQSWKQIIPDVRAGRLRDVIARALAVTGVSAADIDLTVPHGAGTQLSDGYEAACLAEALEGKGGNGVATCFKPYVGHMLAASGVVETICALLALRQGSIPATLGTRPGQATLCVPIVTTLTERPINTILKLSTGFTGHDGASLFTRSQP
ncbi:MAG: beta-ketoacyl synthase N-terminal-like domain-containing protein [Planctomycetota bacterium]